MKEGFVYIMANERNGTIYIGVTSNLIRRVFEHKEALVSGFTQEHGLKMLVYFEKAETIDAAILREKQLKKWRRDWKLHLIESMNPDWTDLYETIL